MQTSSNKKSPNLGLFLFTCFFRQLLDKSFSSQNRLHKFSFILRVKNAERKMNELRLGHDQDKVFLVHLGLLDHVPFDGHSLFGIDLHKDLSAINFIRELVEHDLVLLHLTNPGKLNYPEQQIQEISKNGHANPPPGGDKKVTSSNGQSNQDYPPLLFKDI